MTDSSRIGDLLQRFLRHSPLSEGLERQQALEIWPEVVGEVIAAHSEAISLEGGVLHVRVDGSVWAQELTMLHDDLLARIQAHAPGAGVKRLRFRVGKLNHPLRISEEDRPEPPPPLRRVPLPESVGVALARINDDRLRRKMLEAAQASLCRADQREAGEL